MCHRGVRDDIDQEDDEESYYRYLEENPNAGLIGDEDDLNIEYDEEGNVIYQEKKVHLYPVLCHCIAVFQTVGALQEHLKF